MYILLGFSIILIWATLMNLFLPWLMLQPSIVSQLFFSCLMAPFLEEILFRVYPFQLLHSIPFKSEATKLKMTFLTAIFSSLVFGFIHGAGWISVLKQGVMGTVFSAVYLKTNKSYLSVVILHSLWNLYCILFL